MLGRQSKLIATMKKLFLIAAAMFAAVSFSACSDDKDEASIVGEWQLTHSVGYVIEAGEQYDFDKTFPNDGYYTGYIFNEDGKGTYYATYTSSTTPEESTPITYSISGKTLTITASGNTQTFEIKELSSAKLVLYENNLDAEYVETNTYKRVK